MIALPSGYRVVGGLSVAFAVLMAAFVVFAIAATPGGLPAPAGAMDWLVAAAFTLAPVGLLAGGGLLFARSAAAHRVARAAFAAAAAALLLLAALMVAAVVQELRHPTSSTGVLIVCAIPLFILPAAAWAAVVLVTATRLGRLAGRGATSAAPPAG